MDAEGLLARCICHELDHLDGVLFIDKVEKIESRCFYENNFYGDS